MRAILGLGGISFFVSGEEHQLIETIREKETVARDSLTERENVLATGLVRRGVLAYTKRSSTKQEIKVSENLYRNDI